MDRKQPPRAVPKRRQPLTLAAATAEMKRVQIEARAWSDLHWWLRHIVEQTSRGVLF